jgi:hypothetical protein
MDAIAPPRTATGRPALEGHLADLAPADLLRLLGETRQTGTLQVLTDVPTLLTLVDGAVSFATDDPARTLREVLLDEGLPRVVLDEGLLDDDMWEAAIAAGGDELGAALVDAGLDEAELARVLRRVIIDTVTDVSLAPQGRFRYVPGRRHSLGSRLHYPVADLLRDLSVRLDEWTSIREDVPSFDLRATLTPVLPNGRANVVISASDWRVMVTVSHAPSLDASRAELGMTRFVLARSVAALVRGGALELAPVD